MDGEDSDKCVGSSLILTKLKRALPFVRSSNGKTDNILIDLIQAEPSR